MRKRLLKCLGATMPLLALLSLESHGISRWGNGTIADLRLGFQASIPSQTLKLKEIKEDRVALYLPAVFDRVGADAPAPGSMPNVLEISPFSFWFNELASYGKEAIRRHLASQTPAWTELPSRDCMIGFTLENDSAVNAIFLWGNGKGIVAAGPRSYYVRQAIQELWNSLKLESGACEWK